MLATTFIQWNLSIMAPLMKGHLSIMAKILVPKGGRYREVPL